VRSSGLALPDFLHHAPLRLLHALEHLLARGAAGEQVGFRQQRALARDVADVAGENVAFQQTLHDLARSQPLRHGEGVLHHLALDDGVDHVVRACVLGELIFAVFQLVARLEQQRAGHEQVGPVDHALAHQQVGSVADAAARDVDDLLLFERAGQIEPLLADHEGDADRNRQHENDGEDRIARDDDGIAPARGAPRRHRHVLGLQRGARTARRNRPRVDHRGAIERRHLQRRIGIAGAGNRTMARGRRRRRRGWRRGVACGGRICRRRLAPRLRLWRRGRRRGSRARRSRRRLSRNARRPCRCGIGGRSDCGRPRRRRARLTRCRPQRRRALLRGGRGAGAGPLRLHRRSGRWPARSGLEWARTRRGRPLRLSGAGSLLTGRRWTRRRRIGWSGMSRRWIRRGGARPTRRRRTRRLRRTRLRCTRLRCTWLRCTWLRRPSPTVAARRLIGRTHLTPAIMRIGPQQRPPQ
jgi:hypothetical protein